MNKRTWIAAAVCVLALSACAHTQRWFAPAPERLARPNAKDPTVWVVDDKYAIVSQEPLIFRKSKNEKDVDIVWTINELESGSTAWVFSTDPPGIVLPASAAGEIGDCESRAGGKKYRCFNKNQRPGLNTYKYTINLWDPQARKSIKLDPVIMND